MNEFRYLLEVNISLTLLFALYRLFLERETFFGTNRFFLLTALVVSFILPFCAIPGLPALFDWRGAESVLSPQLGAVVGNPGIDPWKVIAWLYSGGVAVLTVRFLYRLVRIASFRARFGGENRGDYTLVTTGEGTSTFSFFHLLFWSDEAGLSDEQRAMVLRHELVHIRQRHSLDILLMEIAGIFCWPNPVIYLFRRHLRELHEFLADAEASAPVDSTSYERLLAVQLIRDSGLPLAQGFAQSRIRRRIEMLRQPRSKRISGFKYIMAIPMLLLVMALFVTNPPGVVIRTAGLIDTGEPMAGIVPGQETSDAHLRHDAASCRNQQREQGTPHGSSGSVPVQMSRRDPVHRVESGSNDIPVPIVATDAIDRMVISVEPPTELSGHEREFILLDTAAHKLAEIDGERIKAQFVPSYRLLFPEPKERQF